MIPLLHVRKVTKTFGGLVALSALSFDLAPGEILGLVGPNGSGKSTMLNILSGVIRADSGEIDLEGCRIDQLSPHEVARAGLGRTFQNLQLFPGLTIAENVQIGRDCRLETNIFDALFRTRRLRAEERALASVADRLLERVGLPGRAHLEPTSLSYGQRRLLEIARALATAPRILMLDEPCAGLSQVEADELAVLIHTLSEEGIGVVVIAHNMRFVMKLVDRMVVLNFGHKIAEGAPSEIRRNEAVISTYLGGDDHAAG